MNYLLSRQTTGIIVDGKVKKLIRVVLGIPQGSNFKGKQKNNTSKAKRVMGIIENLGGVCKGTSCQTMEQL